MTDEQKESIRHYIVHPGGRRHLVSIASILPKKLGGTYRLGDYEVATPQNYESYRDYDEAVVAAKKLAEESEGKTSYKDFTTHT